MMADEQNHQQYYEAAYERLIKKKRSFLCFRYFWVEMDRN